MSRPRILYILSSLAANDLGDEIVTILGRLSRSEFEPRVIALGGKEELLGRLVEMKVRCYPLGLSGAFGAYRAVSKTRTLLRKVDPAVVHGYGSWGDHVESWMRARDRGVLVELVRFEDFRSDPVAGLLGIAPLVSALQSPISPLPLSPAAPGKRS